MTNCEPCSIVGSVTQTSDVPCGSHVSISNGRPLPDMSMKQRSEPVVESSICEYWKPETVSGEMRTRTGKSVSVPLLAS